MSDYAKPPNAEEVDRIAAEWVLRERGGLTMRERNELDEWLRDSRHEEAFTEMKRTSELLDGLGDPTPLESSPSTRLIHWLAVGLAAAAAVTMVTVWNGSRHPGNPKADSFTQAAATRMGESTTLRLSDGSQIGLNTDSTVKIVYSGRERRIELTRGEAFFTVAKDPERPFWVEAGQVSVRAVGTAFNVRHRAGAVEVIVKEGQVTLRRENNPRAEPMLSAGQKAVLEFADQSEAATIVPIEAARIQSMLAWQQHRLEFSETPLRDVIAEFNRYNRHQLVIDDPALAAQTFGGAFATSGYASFVEVLEQSFGVVAERRADVTILRKAR